MTRTWLAAALLAAWGVGLAPGGGGAQKAPDLKMSDAEKKLLSLTNDERAKHKLPLLKPNAKLFAAARGHAAVMARLNKLEHVIDGVTPGGRAKKQGYRFAEIAENIAYGAVTMEDIMKGWMESKIHRDNILAKDFTEIGLGLATNADGEIYYAQLFATPLKAE
jgi:uncharacterized protein YkwD